MIEIEKREPKQDLEAIQENPPAENFQSGPLIVFYKDEDVRDESEYTSNTSKQKLNSQLPSFDIFPEPNLKSVTPNKEEPTLPNTEQKSIERE